MADRDIAALLRDAAEHLRQAMRALKDAADLKTATFKATTGADDRASRDDILLLRDEVQDVFARVVVRAVAEGADQPIKR